MIEVEYCWLATVRTMVSRGIWIYPGGRMDAGEGFLDTLKRELHEEIGTSYTGIPEYFDTVLSNVQPHIEYGQVGLVLLVYHTKLPESGVLKLGEQEHVYKWCEPTEAAELLQFKYPADFCESVKGM